MNEMYVTTSIIIVPIFNTNIKFIIIIINTHLITKIADRMMHTSTIGVSYNLQHHLNHNLTKKSNLVSGDCSFFL